MNTHPLETTLGRLSGARSPSIARPAGADDRLGRLLGAGQASVSFLARRLRAFARERPALFATAATGAGLGLWVRAKAKRDGLVVSRDPHTSLFLPPESYVKAHFLPRASDVPLRGARRFLLPLDRCAESDDGRQKSHAGIPSSSDEEAAAAAARGGEGDGVRTPSPVSTSAAFARLLPPELRPQHAAAALRSASASPLRVTRSGLLRVGSGEAAFRQTSQLVHAFDPALFARRGGGGAGNHASLAGQRERGAAPEEAAGEELFFRFLTGAGAQEARPRGGRGAGRPPCVEAARPGAEGLQTGAAVALLLRRGRLCWRLIPLRLAAKETHCALFADQEGARPEAAPRGSSGEEDGERARRQPRKCGDAEAANADDARQRGDAKTDEAEETGGTQGGGTESIQGGEEETAYRETERRGEREGRPPPPRGAPRCSALWFVAAPSVPALSTSQEFLVVRVFLLPPSACGAAPAYRRAPAPSPPPPSASPPAVASCASASATDRAAEKAVEGDVFIEVLAIRPAEAQRAQPAPLFSAEFVQAVAQRAAAGLRRELQAQALRLRALERLQGGEHAREQGGDEGLSEDAPWGGLEATIEIWAGEDEPFASSASAASSQGSWRPRSDVRRGAQERQDAEDAAAPGFPQDETVQGPLRQDGGPRVSRAAGGKRSLARAARGWRDFFGLGARRRLSRRWDGPPGARSFFNSPRRGSHWRPRPPTRGG
ncbi:hypothetical protein BESB_012110 [Besnoitia besnoiti]|uniref:Uncharacterized protein n=1 Tax=Besnoitia besnoiti TaxID=94643 RepID=A0A2A9M3S8_BESBE|nr:hypothetical protein BESB_012110 [Besnoitia besnoiti]PFH32599.1 hypothetical protein BESB_012110 [Besnoitia besnoiti]